MEHPERHSGVPQAAAERARAIRAGAWRVRAVIPSFNRHRDVEVLLDDLARLELGAIAGGADLSVTLVDNASEPALESVAHPPGLRVEHVRLEQNRGGSGGFSAGILFDLERGVPGDPSDLIWLIDSDARLAPDSLAPLIEALAARPALAAVGSVLCDPATREPFEFGGAIDERAGELVQPAPPFPMPEVFEVPYVAACSMLVRRAAAERAGPMMDLFLCGDDVEWCLRLAERWPGTIGVATRSRVFHPRPSRMRTLGRYFAARNGFVPIAARGLGGRVRFRRALREVGRALAQVFVGRDDLARLHIRGLADAARGRFTSPHRPPAFEGMSPFDALYEQLVKAVGDRYVDPRAIRLALTLAQDAPADDWWGPRGTVSVWKTVRVLLVRLTLGPPMNVAVVSARARPADWLAGRVLVTIAPEGFAIRRISRLGRAWSALGTTGKGLVLALRLGLREPPGWREARPGAIEPDARRRPASALNTAPALSVVIVSYRRPDALHRTLEHLAAMDMDAEVIVVDNASGEGLSGGVRAAFPWTRVIDMPANAGVEAFNRGVREARGELVLVLDDDARPDACSLGSAIAALESRPELAAVTLHPFHPATRESEWRFACVGGIARDRWPVMGCANLVRRTDWIRAGGYEERFFLYRNDADLALKLLALGRGVLFDPAWIAWHDTPAAARKSARWFSLATRNWIWMARRHGRGASKWLGLLAGWAWAHRLAGARPGVHARVVRGALAGLFTPAPRVAGARPDGRAFAELLALRRRGRGQRPEPPAASIESKPLHSA